jgi:hypothetical protein
VEPAVATAAQQAKMFQMIAYARQQGVHLVFAATK